MNDEIEKAIVPALTCQCVMRDHLAHRHKDICDEDATAQIDTPFGKFAVCRFCEYKLLTGGHTAPARGDA